MNKEVPWYYLNPKDGSEMVLVPGGWFWMGARDDDTKASDDEKPRHLHYTAPFYIGLTCVTVGQFKRFVDDTAHDAGTDWREDPDEHPVRFVNWHDARKYVEWAGLRLPGEAEWELSARGYEALIYPWGDDWESGRKVCWDGQKGPLGSTTPVFDHPEGVSRVGSFQQSGNLWEWCEDGYDEKVYNRYKTGDYTTPSSGSRVLRGASWGSVNPGVFRGGYRFYVGPGFRFDLYGFRAAKTV